MYLLAIETTGAFASVALVQDDRLLAHISGNDRFSHLQNLMPQVDAVIKESKLSLDDITAIAVSAGPGSFTGIRIGVSSARALAQVLGIPCVPVSSLAALAMRAAEAESGTGACRCGGEGTFSAIKTADGTGGNANSAAGQLYTGEQPLAGDTDKATNRAENQLCGGDKALAGTADVDGDKALAGAAGVQDGHDTAADCQDLLVCPMLDARRSQVYAGGYFLRDGYPIEEVKAGPYLLEEFLSKTAGHHRILLLGDAIDRYGEKIRELRPEGTETIPKRIRYQDAAAVAKLGLKIFREKGGLSYQDVKPDYMRLAEAERKLRERQGLQST